MEYDVIVRRDGRFWYLEIPALNGATQARRLGEVDEMARDYIAVMTDADPSSFDIRVELRLPEDVRSHLSRASELREQAAAAQSSAAEEVRVAARALKDSGLTIREVGTALGVSHQRAHQLVS